MADLFLGPNVQAGLSVKVRPVNPDGLAAGGECFAGLSLAGTTEGRYLAVLVVRKDGGGGLYRTLRVAWVPVATNQPETVAETELKRLWDEWTRVG